MGKRREKLRQFFHKHHPATAAPVTLSQSTSASLGNLTEQHVPPDPPAQLIATPQVQAILIASPPHAVKTNVPPPVPPVVDPPAEPDLEAEGRQPVMKLTQRQTETSLGSSGPLRPRTSCLDKAAEKLKEDRPDVYTKLEKIKSGRENWSQSDPAGLLELAVSKMQDNEGIPRVIETAIRSILQFKEIVAAAANLDPHKIAPTVWRGFCVVLEACLSESTQLREALTDLDAITSNLSYWANVESLFLGKMRSATLNKFEPLEFDLIKLYIEILILQLEMVNWVSDGGIVQVFKSQDRAATWRDLVKKISNYHGACKSTFDRCKLESDQHGKVKKWISEYRPEQAHDDALQRTGVALKYRTCGQWLLDDLRFTEWSSPEPAVDCRILWLRGTTGTGKSTLLTRIIQWHLDRASLYPDRRLAYFYCSRGTDMNSKHSYKSVLQAILRQAAYDPMKGEISTHVLDAYINAGGDSGDIQTFSFTKCEALLHRILESGIKLRIMIDALDECDEPKELLKVLRSASRVMPGGLELLMSSRHEVHVDEKFSNTIIIDLEESMSETDMITYIKSEVTDKEEDERILKGKYPDLEGRLIEILCRRAGGIHLNQLDTSSVAVGKDLNIAYDDIFKRNTAEGTLEHYHATKIYKMLLCCRKPFSITTVIEALTFGEDNDPGCESIDHAYVRQITQDFIVETERGTLEFAHVSVKDYLQGKHQSDYSDAKCHAQVALICLKYISSQDRTAYEVKLQSDKFLQYSHAYWGEHCAHLSREDRQSLGLSKELIGWIVEGSGSTMIQDWLPAAKRLRALSGRLYNAEFSDPIFLACYWNLIEVMEKLLSANPAYNLNLHPNYDGYTPLLLASIRGHKAIVKLLLERKANINATSKCGNTPLYLASGKGDVEIVKLLLENGADTNAVNAGGDAPLKLASEQGYVKIVKLLLEKGANANGVGWDGRTPLQQASRDGHIEVVKVLLEKGANLNAIGQHGYTPFYWALWARHIKVVKLLLEKGADVNVVDEYGETPLHLALGQGHFEVVKLLLEKGADVNGTNDNVRTPLYLASESGDIEIIKLLLEKGANIKTANLSGRTPLHGASSQGYIEVVKLLLEKGADMNAADRWGGTPLKCASGREHFEVVKLLLKKGVDLNTVDHCGTGTPLPWAARCGHVEVVKLLLEKGADVNAVDQCRGGTPLHWASEGGYIEVVKLLLKKGADANAADQCGSTPLHRALENEQVEIIKLLSDSG